MTDQQNRNPTLDGRNRVPSDIGAAPLVEHGGLPRNPVRPLIYLTTRDHERIRALITRPDLPADDDLRHVLMRELERAIVCAPEAIPRNVVTLNSRVRYRPHIGRRVETHTLIDNGDMARPGETISVLTPLGAALLGLAEGSHMPYALGDGTRSMLAVEKIAYQPETHGRYIVAPHRYWPAPRTRDGRNAKEQHGPVPNLDALAVMRLPARQKPLSRVTDDDDGDGRGSGAP